MLSAAYAILGITQENGAVHVRGHLFGPKDALQGETLRIGERVRRRSSGN
jgi:hypothetical protein